MWQYRISVCTYFSESRSLVICPIFRISVPFGIIVGYPKVSYNSLSTSEHCLALLMLGEVWRSKGANYARALENNNC